MKKNKKLSRDLNPSRLREEASILSFSDGSKDYGNPWINELVYFPEHMIKHTWFYMLGSGLKDPGKEYPNGFKVGPRLSTEQDHVPYDLRCNCCFVCSWLLRLTVLPIIKIMDFFKQQYIKATTLPNIRYE